MGYTGDVAVGGPAQTHNAWGFSVTKLAVGPMDNNAYLLRCTSTGSLCLVDAAAEGDRLLELVGGRPLDLVVTTHRHADHWQALGEVVAATSARTAAGRADADGIPVATDQLLDDGDELWVGDVGLRVIHLAGHTPGSVALLADDARDASGADEDTFRVAPPQLFTGDSLFPGGVGRTTSPEAFTSLIDDVEHKLFGPLPDDTWVYPGHGRDTTLGQERPHLAEWRARGW